MHKSRPLLMLFALLSSAAAAGAQSLPMDHLKCYRVTDTSDYRASLQLLGRQFGDETKCSVKVRAVYYCVAVAARVDATNAPAAQVEGEEIEKDRICYEVECPPLEPAEREVVDRFGARKLVRGQLELVCTPAVAKDAGRRRRRPSASRPAPPWYAGQPAVASGTAAVPPAQTAGAPSAMPPAQGRPCGTLLAVLGNGGEREGQFDGPAGLALDSSGRLYVADTGNDRIQGFTGAGWFLTAWGESGGRPGQFESPWDVAVDSQGAVYVADTKRHRVQKFEADGTFALEWGKSGTAPGEFVAPYAIAVGPNDTVYVADTGNDRIQRFDSSGRFQTAWGSRGKRPGQFAGPYGIAVAPTGEVFVADRHNRRIQKFDADGKLLAVIGQDDERLGEPFAIAVDSSGNLFVTDVEHDRVVAIDPRGEIIARWGGSGSARGKLSFPAGVAVDPTGRVYVSDRNNNRVAVFGCAP